MSPDALELELERLHAAAFGWALACCAGDRAAAEDALQASYLKILDRSARFDGRATFRTWLFGVVRRTAAEQRRRTALRRLLPLAVLDAARGRRRCGLPLRRLSSRRWPSPWCSPPEGGTAWRSTWPGRHGRCPVTFCSRCRAPSCCAPCRSSAG